MYCFDQDLSRQKEAEKALQYQANYDLLTRLPNRQYLFKHLHSLINKASRQESKFALLFLDLDEFKLVNDQYGHNYGDALLQQVAQRLESVLREYDFLARYGGDEFIISFEFTQEEHQSSTIAQKSYQVSPKLILY